MVGRGALGAGLDRDLLGDRLDGQAGVLRLVDADCLAGLEAARQQRLGELVLDHVLDDAAQRPRAVVDVVAELDDVVLGFLRDLELDLLGVELVAHPREQQLDDHPDLLDLEAAEDDDRVDAVQELGPELRLELVEDLLLHPVVGLLLVLGLVDRDRLEAEARVLEERLRADVAGHDDDRVAEVDPAALGVGQVAVLEDLEQDVEHLGVGLLDLVEQDHAVALAAHGLGQLAALVEADVAWRRADEAAHVVALHELAHVDLDERVL